jgi:predicted negative regulator of RcsB-dependent stress response
MSDRIQNIKNQRGSMVLELLLVAAVLALFGFVGWHYYAAQQTANTPAVTNIASSKKEPNGKVDNTVNEVTSDAVSDDTLTAGMSKDAEDLLSSDDEAVQVEGSINNASF